MVKNALGKALVVRMLLFDDLSGSHLLITFSECECDFRPRHIVL